MMIGDISKVCDLNGITPITVSGTNVVYCRSMNLSKAEIFGLWIMLASTNGTPNVKIEFEQSAVPVAAANDVAPGAADSNWAVADGVTPVYSALNDKVAYIKTLTPVPMMHGRFKLTGNVGNQTDTTVDIRMFRQEKN